MQERACVPRDRIEALVGRDDQFGRQILGGEIARHLCGNIQLRRYARDRGLHLLGHCDEQIDARGGVERRGARRHQIAAMRADAFGQFGSLVGR